jgi:hypothetical protein
MHSQDRRQVIKHRQNLRIQRIPQVLGGRTLPVPVIQGIFNSTSPARFVTTNRPFPSDIVRKGTTIQIFPKRPLRASITRVQVNSRGTNINQMKCGEGRTMLHMFTHNQLPSTCNTLKQLGKIKQVQKEAAKPVSD